MAEENKVNIDGQNLDDVSGGQGGAGYNMTVGPCNGTYLALRPQPVSAGVSVNLYIRRCNLP